MGSMAWDNFFTNAVPGRCHIKQVRWLSSKSHCIAVLQNGNSNFKASDIEWSSFLISVVQLENLFCLLAAEYANFHEINFAPNFPSPASKLILIYAAMHYRFPMLSEYSFMIFYANKFEVKFSQLSYSFQGLGILFWREKNSQEHHHYSKSFARSSSGMKGSCSHDVTMALICVCLYFYKVCPNDYFASSSP